MLKDKRWICPHTGTQKITTAKNRVKEKITDGVEETRTHESEKKRRLTHRCVFPCYCRCG